MAPSGAVLLCSPPASISAESDGSSFDNAAAAATATSTVVVVGVDHGDLDPSLGAFVLSSRPAAVVVETALCARHGAETGNCLSLSEEDEESAGFGGGGRWETSDGEQMKPLSPFEAAEEEPHVAQCLGLALRLAALPEGSPERTAFWQALSQHFAGEQLAYVAALSTGSRLVFGDRPKRETVRRLCGRLSAAELDRAVAAQAARNTLESLTGGIAPPPNPSDGGGFGRAYDVLVRERDAAICAAVAREVEREEARAVRARGGGGGESDDDDDDASSSSSVSTSFPLSSSNASKSSSSSTRPIVVVVGKWHLEGVRSLWESGEWRSVLEREQAEAQTLLPARHPSLSAAEDLGLRRALVDELLSSTATAESAEEVDPEAFGGAFVVNGEGDSEAEEAAARAAYALTAELYGTARMQLALLDSRAQFDAVVSGWRCDFWEAVGPVRGVRAANGGKGFFDERELVEKLRTLNFIFEEVEPK